MKGWVGSRTLVRGAAVAFLLVAVACVVPYPFEASKATSGSMAPTINVGDWFVWRRYLPGEKKTFRRGDIVVFEFPFEPAPGQTTVLYVKRVLGLPGETIRFVDGEVWIDGHPIEEPWGHSFAPIPHQTMADYPISRDALYVLGDNRGASTDSRAWGLLPVRKVVGIVSRPGD